jgi:ribosomal protein S18 acetylase RimI-like enzyme
MVAAEDDHVVAFCAFNEIYPGPGLEAGIFLKELYVAQSRRGFGLGRSLMRELAAIARQRQLTRIDWTADADDQRLLHFYDRLGATSKPEKLFYRLDGDALFSLSCS